MLLASLRGLLLMLLQVACPPTRSSFSIAISRSAFSTENQCFCFKQLVVNAVKVNGGLIYITHHRTCIHAIMHTRSTFEINIMSTLSPATSSQQQRCFFSCKCQYIYMYIFYMVCLSKYSAGTATRLPASERLMVGCCSFISGRCLRWREMPT